MERNGQCMTTSILLRTGLKLFLIAWLQLYDNTTSHEASWFVLQFMILLSQFVTGPAKTGHVG